MQTTLGHYRVIAPIGSGGMGTVYLARDERLERDVAIKVLSGTESIEEEARRRFRREALALSKLNHPNVATIHDFATFDDQDVLVMEHIPGRDLADVVRDGPLPEAEIVRIGQQLLGALEAAHARHIIHRDLKPGNIRLTEDGRVKVLDFGLAHALAVGGDATTASLSVPGFAGTLPYMAPEQVRGDAVDARTDIYGAGAVLYEMATGTRVHPGLTGPRLLGAILEEPSLPARALNPRLSPALESILCKALDRDPRLRYHSAREMCVDLERLVAPERPATARPVWQRRRVLAVAAGILAGALALGGWLLWPADPFTGRILVADFDDRAGDPELALVLRELLTLRLQDSSKLNVLSHDQVVDALRRMGRGAREPLDAGTAAELAQREGIPLVLAGTTHRQGARVLIAVSGIDPLTRAALFNEDAEYDEDRQLGSALSTLARKVRRRLGESLAAIEQDTRPLDQVTTSSLEALKLYSRGAEATRQGDADTGVRLLSGALDIDPSFAMAHRLIARLYGTVGNAAKQQEHLEKAYELRDRLTRRERLHVEASYFNGRGEYDKAVTSLEGAMNLFPGDADSRYELALAYRDAGASHRAIELLEDALLASPLTTPAYADLVLLRTRVGDHAGAWSAYEDARKRNITSAKLEWARGMVLLGEGRMEEARTQLETVAQTSGTYAGTARLYLATADILDGRLQSASRQLQADLMIDSTDALDSPELVRRRLLVKTLLLRGLTDEARRQLQILLARSPEPGTSDWLSAGRLLLELGDVARARTLLTESDDVPAASRHAQSCYYSLAGEVALAEGRVADAVAAFSAAATQFPLVTTTRALARAYAAQGDFARAQQEWKNVVASKGEALREHVAAQWVLAHLELARASHHLGDAAAARAEYDAFLTLWQGGDDVPTLRAAATERRALDP
jgi:eukaryotic-like serine/threonine-protein kinase